MIGEQDGKRKKQKGKPKTRVEIGERTTGMSVQHVPRVIVKFKDTLVRALKDDKTDAAEQFLAQLIAGKDWGQLVAQPQFQGIIIEKLFTALSQARLLDLVDIATQQDRTYRPPNFLTYFSIPCSTNEVAEAVAHELSSQPWQNMVQFAYVAGAPGDLPQVPNPSQNPQWLYRDTDFLKKAPAGIDAEYAWKITGGDGEVASLQFVDIEWAWNLTHQDLPNGIQIIPVGRQRVSVNHRIKSSDHGTAVLGVVAARDNTKLSLGVTPNLPGTAIMVAPVWRYSSGGWHFEPANTILAANARLRFGDVLLLELQITQDGKLNLPAEYDRDTFDAIRQATALGIIVIAAAGNNSHDLDNLGIPWLNRNSPQFEDSGAIMVSAASPWVNGGVPPNPPDFVHAPMPVNSTGSRLHNYGSRIDCYAWGDNVYATRLNSKGGGNFGDTSGASAIIAGAALALQGIAQAHRIKNQANDIDNRFSPGELRTILSNPSTGTPSASPGADKIGVMPDLRRIIENLRARGYPIPP